MLAYSGYGSIYPVYRDCCGVGVFLSLDGLTMYIKTSCILSVFGLSLHSKLTCSGNLK